MTQPNFFIAGAPKAGTTSLYHYLDQHPEIYMSPIKEPSYFAAELRPENFCPEFQAQVQREVQEARGYIRGAMIEKRFGGPVVEWSDYLSLFREAGHATAIGEASVSYLWSRTAARNIAAKIPDARIIVMLRSPAERAYSQYLQAVSAGLVRRSLRAQVQVHARNESVQFGVLQPWLEFGMYSEQVRRYLDAFPRGHVRVYLYQDYRRDPKATLRELFQFLEVDESFQPDFSRRLMEPRVPHSVLAGYWLKRMGVWQGVKRWSPAPLRKALRSAAVKDPSALSMKTRDKRELQEHYREDIGKLEQLLGRDLRTWLE